MIGARVLQEYVHRLKRMDESLPSTEKAQPKPKYDHKVIRPHGPWVPASQTDVSSTWAKAREQLQKHPRPAART